MIKAGAAYLDIAKKNREIQRRLFGVLKGVSVAPSLCFVFLTGVSRFSRVSIFSELNNLDDISMSRLYSEMLGYTDDELTSSFRGHIDRFADETGQTAEEIVSQLTHHYDGYRFSREPVSVYNPFSVLKALHHMAFHHYWFETGTPTFLVDLLKRRQYPIPEIENMRVDEQVFNTFELDDLKPEAIMFQAGYLTIKGLEGSLYRLGYPNQEVKNAFLKHLMFSFAQGIGGEAGSRFLSLSRFLCDEDFQSFFDTLTAIFASIPYSLQSKRDEAYFHTLFYLMVSASGMEARSEILTCRGRIDLAVFVADKVFIMEFKCNQSAETAIKQIRKKGYADSYAGSEHPLFLMGINFSTEKRNVADWSVVKAESD